MTRSEALNLRVFDEYCMCGGYAWARNGRDPMRPHMEWCPQREQYNAWADALGEDGVRNFNRRSDRVRDEVSDVSP